jgi:glycosyl transferase family 25
MDTIEKVVYINLEHRTDRRAQVEEQLAVFGDRVERFSAIQKSPGGVGCSMSHLAVLKRAKEQGWKNVLIVEDDFVWCKTEEGMTIFDKISKNPYDVIMLGGAYLKYDTVTYKLLSGQTALAYIVDSSYYDTLISNFKEGLEGFLRTMNYPVYALDQYWKHLQPHDRWYVIRPSLCMQRPSFSDIEQAHVDYRRAYL